MSFPLFCLFFFFNDTATTEIYTLSLHDALPIFVPSTEGASRLTLAVCDGMSTAPATFTDDRSKVPVWPAVTVPLKVPVNSKDFTPSSDVTALVTISFGSLRAGAAGGPPQEPRIKETAAARTSGR